jgi:hypothetical protein
MKPNSLYRFRFTTHHFIPRQPHCTIATLRKRLSYHKSNTLQLRILFAQALKTISRKYWILATWKLMKGRNLMSNRKCWKAARWRCEEFKCRQQRPRGDPNCTPCLQNSNNEVAATTSQLLLMARKLLYSYYTIRMIKFVRKKKIYLSSLMMKVPDHVYVLGQTYTCHTYCCYAYRLYFLTCDMYKSSLRHIHDTVLLSLKMKGIRLLFLYAYISPACLALIDRKSVV